MQSVMRYLILAAMVVMCGCEQGKRDATVIQVRSIANDAYDLGYKTGWNDAICEAAKNRDSEFFVKNCGAYPQHLHLTDKDEWERTK